MPSPVAWPYDAGLGWVWGVHLESSTGTLNDLAGLRDLAIRVGVRVCIDGVSSLGAVPLDLRGVHLATGSSGKALGAYAGLGIVFAGPKDGRAPSRHRRRVPTCFSRPRGRALAAPWPAVPPSPTSPLLGALDRALDDYATPAARAARYAHYAALGRSVRSGLRALGLDPISGDVAAAPVITTFAPRVGFPPEGSRRRVARWATRSPTPAATSVAAAGSRSPRWAT